MFWSINGLNHTFSEDSYSSCNYSRLVRVKVTLYFLHAQIQPQISKTMPKIATVAPMIFAATLTTSSTLISQWHQSYFEFKLRSSSIMLYIMLSQSSIVMFLKVLITQFMQVLLYLFCYLNSIVSISQPPGHTSPQINDISAILDD